MFFSANAKYQPENLTAYELGYKGEILDGTMQVNSALYFYDYKHVHTFGSEPVGVRRQFVDSVFAVPSAQMYRLGYRRAVAGQPAHHARR